MNGDCSSFLSHVYQDLSDTLDVRRLAEEFAGRSDIPNGVVGNWIQTKLLEGFTDFCSDYFVKTFVCHGIVLSALVA